jgi:hypothetical protein
MWFPKRSFQTSSQKPWGKPVLLLAEACGDGICPHIFRFGNQSDHFTIAAAPPDEGGEDISVFVRNQYERSGDQCPDKYPGGSAEIKMGRKSLPFRTQ